MDSLYIISFFFLEVHRLRPHPGQNKVAKRLRSLLHSDTYPSEIAGLFIFHINFKNFS